MIVNPDKFKSIIIKKVIKQANLNLKFLPGNSVVEFTLSVKLIGIHVDDQLNFNLNINNICKFVSKELNALVRLKYLLDFEEKEVLISSFFLSNFNSCPLVWSISSAKSLNKVENLQKRVLRFLRNDYRSSYNELLKESGKNTVNVSNYRTLCIEIFKTLNNINLSFIKEILQLTMASRPTQVKYKLNLEIPKSNQVRFGTKRLRYLGPKVCNSLPHHIKS